MIRNERALPILDRGLLDAIFDHVYDNLGNQVPDIADKELRDFVQLLSVMQNYNHWYRNTEYAQLFPVFEATVGPMEKNSEGTDMWLALGLAVKELYGLRLSTLQSLLEKVTVRK